MSGKEIESWIKQVYLGLLENVNRPISYPSNLFDLADVLELKSALDSSSLKEPHYGDQIPAIHS